VVATGDRCRDLSVRLWYGGVEHSTEPDPIAAVQKAATATAATAAATATAATAAAGAAAAPPNAVVDVIGNYTAFGDLLGAGT
jgi:hypothetical protein